MRAIGMSDQPITYLIHCIVENGMLDTGCWMLDAGLSSVQYRDIAAVARGVGARKAGELTSDDEQLRSWLAAYQETNIDIFRHFIMLPLRFGIMADRKEEIEDFLSVSYIHLKWALDRLRGKAEFAVQLSWNLNAVLQEIGHHKRLKSKLELFRGMGDFSHSQRSKMSMGRLLFQAADKKKKEIVESVHRKLIAVSLDSAEGRSGDESVIMNRSYLIEKAAEASFDEAMAELGRENESYLSFRYVGPIPPYSFAPLEFKRGNFELIDDARRKLYLPERARFDEIRASYRRLSLKYHPDKNTDDRQSSERFRQVDEAYKILEAYCCSCGGSLASGETQAQGRLIKRPSREDAIYSFAKDDVEEVFIVERALAR
jgi:hypothetical protein